MASQDLDIDLRLRRRQFIEQASARRPRLSGNLKQLGARGPVVRPIAASSQPVVAKVVITNATTTGSHLYYLQHGKGPGGQDAALFGPGAQDTKALAKAAQQDPHQFRVMVSPPVSSRLDLSQFVDLFMRQVTKDLGAGQDWVGAIHHDTARTHAHIIVRGRDAQGKDLYMNKDYMTYGLRARASQLLTWMIGPVRQAQQQQMIQIERQTYNGVTRGADDPDARQRVTGRADTQRQWLMPKTEESVTVERLTRQQHGMAPTPKGSSLSDQLATLRETLHQQQDAAQRSRHQGQGRGQGMGW